MSGGTFEYRQHHIEEIIREIKRHLKEMGQPIPKEELYMSQKYYKKYPEDKYYDDYTKETKQEFRNAIEILEKAYIYAQRIDWLLAGDDGEDTFINRLQEELLSVKPALTQKGSNNIAKGK